MNNDLIALLQSEEGFRSSPYWDVNAYRVGYGSDTITLPDGRVIRVEPGMSITEEDAMRDLERRLQDEFIPIVIDSIGQEAWEEMTPGRQAALVSLAYNYGRVPTTVVNAVRSGDHRQASNAISNLSANPERRQREAALYSGEERPYASPFGQATQDRRTPASGPRSHPILEALSQLESRPGIAGLAQRALEAGPRLRGILQEKGLSGLVSLFKSNVADRISQRDQRRANPEPPRRVHGDPNAPIPPMPVGPQPVIERGHPLRDIILQRRNTV